MIGPHPSNRLRRPARQSVKANHREAQEVDRSIPHDT